MLLLHIGTSYLFVIAFDGGYIAAGVAYSLSRVYYFLMQAAYIQFAGLGARVWGRPTARAWAQWPQFARLAYPAAALRCMESFCYSALTVIAGASPPRSHRRDMVRERILPPARRPGSCRRVPSAPKAVFAAQNRQTHPP